MQDALVSGVASAVREAGGTTRRPEILCLTSLSCLAALEVVLLHTLFELGGKPTQGLPSFVVSLGTRGGAAVSFFFVLSWSSSRTSGRQARHARGRRASFWRARFASHPLAPRAEVLA